MPLGEVEEDRTEHYLPLSEVRARLAEEFDLMPSLARTGGPARYYEVEGLGIRQGLITPLTHNLSDGCHRIRVAATGTVFGCLGHDQRVELRELMRSGGSECVNRELDRLLAGKPKGHQFQIEEARPAVARHMSVTGG
jgi:cyclic pyranopterin phosphate synthase